VATLTRSQSGLLVWMVESGASSFVFERFGPKDFLKAVGGPEREVEGSDFRELAHQGLIRPTTGRGYEISNEGRIAYQEITSPPPPEREPPGFRPQ
jgi:hypothetical protein